MVVAVAGQFGGITPACAGISAVLEGKSQHTGDHPRVRGDKFLRATPDGKLEGSPPRARG